MIGQKCHSTKNQYAIAVFLEISAVGSDTSLGQNLSMSQFFAALSNKNYVLTES
jgi:hypothetical protein